MTFHHIPVLLQEIFSYIPENAKTVGDFTLGGAGHSSYFLEHRPDIFLYGIDQDADALNAANKRLSPYEGRYELIHNSFAGAAEGLLDTNVKFDFILADLGVSSYQLDTADRGFSFLREGPLDMRMNKAEDLTAAIVVNEYDEKALLRIIRAYGEESFARPIVKNIIRTRNKKPFTTTLELAECIKDAVPKKMHFKRIHPATKSFQAIRIEVNNELGQLESFLSSGLDLLNPGGRIAIISFHSLEDRPVKQFFKKQEFPCTCPSDFPICTCHRVATIKKLHRKIITATEEEKSENPRSRSAKLRIVEKL